MSDKGRWFRVYARQIEEHDKFRELTGLELGAWTALRSAAELRDRAVIRDRDEAVLILKRRKIPRPAAVLATLIADRLFDVDEAGRITVHDRSDHDRQEEKPSDQQRHRRDHRRSEPEPGCDWCQVEQWDRSAGDHGLWIPRVEDVDVDSPQDVVSGLPQQADSAPATANSIQPQPAGAGLPADGDSATLACRYFLNGGKWLGDAEYVKAWDDLDDRYTKPWVLSEIQPAYSELHAESVKVKPWDLHRKVEFRLADRARAEEREREAAEAKRVREEVARQRAKEAAATDEEKARASLIRRAIRLWIQINPSDPVPEDRDELAAWLETQESRPAA